MQKDPRRLPPLDLLAAFEAAARHLSFTRAAAERHITQSAMSRQIQALEADLGVPLFLRAHRRLALTEAGQRLLASCTSVLQQLRDVVGGLRAPAQRQVLALSTTPGLAALWLIPRLPLFTREHPGIDVRLDASLETRRLREDGFDLAIRYAGVGSVGGPLLFGEAMSPVCSPQLLRHGPPLRTPADLAGHTLLRQAAEPHGVAMPMEWDLWLQSVGLADLQPASALTFNGYDAAIAAALAGQGVALGRRPLIDGLLRARRLVAPFPDTLAIPRGYYLMVEPEAAARPAVQALVDWLGAQARETVRAAGRPAAKPLRPAAPQAAPGAASPGAARPREREPTAQTTPATSSAAPTSVAGDGQWPRSSSA